MRQTLLKILLEELIKQLQETDRRIKSFEAASKKQGPSQQQGMNDQTAANTQAADTTAENDTEDTVVLSENKTVDDDVEAENVIADDEVSDAEETDEAYESLVFDSATSGDETEASLSPGADTEEPGNFIDFLQDSDEGVFEDYQATVDSKKADQAAQKEQPAPDQDLESAGPTFAA